MLYDWKPQAVSVKDLIEWPRFFRARSFILEGEYRGWRAKGLGAPVSAGPPKHRGDWIFRDETGALYVTGESPKGLDPITDCGRRIRVEGTCGLTDAKVPYVRAQTITLL